MPAAPEVARAGIERIEGELRRDQRDILARLRHLSRHGLAQFDVAFERRTLSVEEEHDQYRPRRIEALRQVEQRAAVAVGHLFPIDVAAARRVATPLAVARVEKRLGRVRDEAAIGKGRSVEGDELRLGVLQARRCRYGGGLRCRRGLWRGGRLRGRLGRLPLAGFLRLGVRGSRHQESPQQQRPPLHATAGRPAPVAWGWSGMMTEKNAGSATR